MNTRTLLKNIGLSLAQLIRSPKKVLVAGLLLLSAPVTANNARRNYETYLNSMGIDPNPSNNFADRARLPSLFDSPFKETKESDDDILRSIGVRPFSSSTPGLYVMPDPAFASSPGIDPVESLMLQKSIDNKDFNTFKSLLEKNPKIAHSSLGSDNLSLWLYTISHNKINFVKYLYKMRAFYQIDINEKFQYLDSAQNPIPTSAFLFSCANGHTKLVKFFYKNRLAIDHEIKTGVYLAASRGRTNVLKAFAKLKVDLELGLITAIPNIIDSEDFLKTLNTFLNADVSPNLKLDDGRSLLKTVVRHQHVAAAKLLMDYKAALYEGSPIAIAVQLENAEIIAEFCNHGYNIFHVDPILKKDLIDFLLDNYDKYFPSQQEKAIYHRLPKSPAVDKLKQAMELRMKEKLKERGVRIFSLDDEPQKESKVFWILLGLRIWIIMVTEFLRIYIKKVTQKTLPPPSTKKKEKPTDIKPAHQEPTYKEYIPPANTSTSQTSSTKDSISTEKEENTSSTTEDTYNSKKQKAPTLSKKDIIAQKLKEKQQSRQQAQEADRIAKENKKKETAAHRSEWQAQQATVKAKQLENNKTVEPKTSNTPAKTSQFRSAATFFPPATSIRKEIPLLVSKAVEHAYYIGAIMQIDYKSNNQNQALLEKIENLALLYHIHRTYLAIAKFRKQQETAAAAAEDIDTKLAVDIRNIGMHASILLDAKSIRSTAAQLKEILPRDIEKLKLRNRHQSALPETEQQLLRNILGTSPDQISLDTIDQTPLYTKVQTYMQSLTSSNSKSAEHPLTHDPVYIEWIHTHIIPTIHEIAALLIKAPPDTKFREYLDYAMRIDAIKMLLAVCGEFHHTGRVKQKITPELFKFRTTCHELRNLVAHHFPDVEDQLILNIAKNLPSSPQPSQHATAAVSLTRSL